MKDFAFAVVSLSLGLAFILAVVGASYWISSNMPG